MPLVFFSGGVDSTVLAFDVAQHPWRYGIEQDKKLILFTYCGGHKNTALEPITKALAKVSVLPIEHVVRKTELSSRPRKGTSSWQTLDPLSAGFRRGSMPYTEGLHTWLAGWAMNLLAAELGDEDQYTNPQALFGFQYDGPAWQVWDEGNLPPNDASPAFIEALNKMTDAAGIDLWFRAPFLDSRMNKDEIALLAREVGAPLDLTSSCVEGWKADCGVCPQCMQRVAVFKAWRKE